MKIFIRQKLLNCISQAESFRLNFWLFALLFFAHPPIVIPPLIQCFSTFFDSRHPSFGYDQFGGTPSYNSPVNRLQIHKLTAPLELFAAPRHLSWEPLLSFFKSRGNALKRGKINIRNCLWRNSIFFCFFVWVGSRVGKLLFYKLR